MYGFECVKFAVRELFSIYISKSCSCGRLFFLTVFSSQFLEDIANRELHRPIRTISVHIVFSQSKQLNTIIKWLLISPATFLRWSTKTVSDLYCIFFHWRVRVGSQYFFEWKYKCVLSRFVWKFVKILLLYCYFFRIKLITSHRKELLNASSIQFFPCLIRHC